MGNKNIKNRRLMEDKKELFIIDGYKIWARNYNEAYANYLVILRL